MRRGREARARADPPRRTRENGIALLEASDSRRGGYPLTGSSTPEKDKATHCGAGRIARLRMHTMSSWEEGVSSGTVSLAGLFEGSFQPSLVDDAGLPRLALAGPVSK